jgi:hypothetical protein
MRHGTVTTAVPGFEVDSDLIGSLRAIDPNRSWYDDSGAVISPWHPYTKTSEKPVPVGALQTYQLELHPRLRSVRPAHRLQVVLTTQSDRLILNAPQLSGLVGGRYTVLAGRSWINLPILAPDAFSATVDPHAVGLR